jgi:L-lactate dehydrogenase complex protein LldF
MATIAKLRERIRRSLDNPILQAALDANAERRLSGRARAFATLPDFEARRRRAQQIRQETIARLDEYFERFLEQARAHGIQVHLADDAAEARQIVLQLIQQRAKEKPLLIAKSKSMISEEIELNHALEAAGHRVVETDLGEYIVQLRGEPPSHIITPAVHLRRQEVGQLFHERLGIPYTEDVAALTQAARRTLRQVFLAADVGISGVNFGVAENGILCIVTNEGNGRMVTTLPRLHIALMGMERLVPGFEDLALMLSLLPRSATGQTLTVYTQLLRGPLQGQERHLIVLDNGRRALHASPLREALHCIRCGACLNACPAFREMGGHAYGSVYPGPIGSVLSPALFGEDFAPLAYACSLCGACEEVCPVKIPLPDLLIRVRSGALPQPLTEGKALSIWMKTGLGLYTWLATHPGAFALAQAFLGCAFGRTGKLRLPPWSGWGQGRVLPAPARRPFRSLWQQERPRPVASGAAIATGTAATPQAGSAGAPRQSARSGQAATGNEIGPRPAGGPDLSLSFSENWKSLGGEIVEVQEELTQAVVKWLRKEGIESLYLDDAPQGMRIEQLQEAVRLSGEAEAMAGLTGVLAAVAESGSLLIASATRAQAVGSLLPPIHLAIVHREQILPSLEAALERVRQRGEASFVLISGPSRTADIEMTLTIGVHGPGRTVVFLCS